MVSVLPLHPTPIILTSAVCLVVHGTATCLRQPTCRDWVSGQTSPGAPSPIENGDSRGCPAPSGESALTRPALRKPLRRGPPDTALRDEIWNVGHGAGRTTLVALWGHKDHGWTGREGLELSCLGWGIWVVVIRSPVMCLKGAGRLGDSQGVSQFSSHGRDFRDGMEAHVFEVV